MGLELESTKKMRRRGIDAGDGSSLGFVLFENIEHLLRWEMVGKRKPENVVKNILIK